MPRPFSGQTREWVSCCPGHSACRPEIGSPVARAIQHVDQRVGVLLPRPFSGQTREWVSCCPGHSAGRPESGCPVAPAIQRADQRVGVLLPWPFSGHANQRVESLPHTVNGGGAGPALSVRLMPPFVYIGSEQTEIVTAHRLHLFQQSRYWCCVLGWCLGLWMGDENMTPRKNRELLKMAFTNVLACVVSVTVLRALRASTLCGRWVL